jgi:2-oxoglutarate dehydrogenase E2 component (dihydrolipoamide succinyltransferase)
MNTDISIPTLGESILEASIGRWWKQSGAAVERDEPICTIESEKATIDLKAEMAGLLEILVPEGETVKIGTLIGRIMAGASRPATVSPTIPNTVPAPAAPRKASSPTARRMMTERGLATDRIQGSGPAGRIMKRDVEAHVAADEVLSAPAVPASPEPRAGERREKLSLLRRTIARHLLAARNETAMLTTFNEIDMSRLLAVRQAHQASFERQNGHKLGIASFFVSACKQALAEYPVINARMDVDDIIFHDYCDIAIAVSTPRGLVVPVIRRADTMDLAAIETHIKELAEKGQNGTLSISEMSGGTFTITNGGVFGSLMSTPLINFPQAAILALHTIQERPVVVAGEIVIRPMMYVALSYDHRLIDGRESVLFVKAVKEKLESDSFLSSLFQPLP